MPLATTPLRRRLAACALFAIAPLGWSQPATLKPSLSAGQQMVYDLSVELATQQTRPGEAEPVASRLSQGARLALTVREVDADGTARLEGTVERVRAAWLRAGEEMAIALPQVTTEVRPDTPAYASMAAVYEAIKGATIALTVNPDGSIAGLRGLEGVAEAAATQEAFDPALLGLFTPRQLTATLEPIFNADGAADAPRAQGAGWQTSETIDLGPAGGLEVVTDWSVTALTDAQATVTGSPRFTAMRRENADAAAPSFTVNDQNAGVMIVWDRAGGALTKREAFQKLTTTWTLGGVTVEQTQAATSSLVRVTQ